MIKSICTLLIAGALVTPAAAQFDFSYDNRERRWTLRNDVIEAQFRLTAAGYFLFEHLRPLRGGDGFTAPPDGSYPIRLGLSDVRYDEGTQYRLVTHARRNGTRGGARYSIVLEDLVRRGRFFLDLDLYAGQPAIRASLRFRNLREQSVRITEAGILSLLLADRGRTYRSFHVNQWWGGGVGGNFEPMQRNLQAGSPSILFTGAYGHHCTWMAIRDSTDSGLFVGWEFDGRALAVANHDRQAARVELRVDPETLSRSLSQGQDFTYPPVFFGLFRGDWDEAAYVTQRFVEAAIAQPAGDPRFPYVVWDSWDYDLHIDETILRRNAEIAASLGIEMFVADLGWSSRIGDWRADPRKFPSGMRALADYVHSLGMKFGVHFALAEADADSSVLLRNPDWRSSENYHYFGADSICLAHRPVREWVLREALRIIEEFDVDWILQDGENMVKHCTKSTHTHDPDDSNYTGAVDGLNWIVDQVKARYPKVEWENCSNGGNMMTYSMTRRYVTSINADNSGPMTTRQAIFGASYPFSARYLDRYMPDTRLTAYITRSYMFGGPWIFMNKLPEMRQQDLDLAASEIRLYKSLRQRIKDGKVFHLTARPAETRIDAIESYHPETDSAVIFVYRPGAAPSSRTVRIRGVKRNETYTVRFQDSSARLSMSGAALLDEGIRMEFGVPYSAEIIYVERER
jgi:hypothetical protein